MLWMIPWVKSCYKVLLPESGSEVYDLVNCGSGSNTFRAKHSGLNCDCCLEDQSMGVPLMIWRMAVTALNHGSNLHQHMWTML